MGRGKGALIKLALVAHEQERRIRALILRLAVANPDGATHSVRTSPFERCAEQRRTHLLAQRLGTDQANRVHQGLRAGSARVQPQTSSAQMWGDPQC